MSRFDDSVDSQEGGFQANEFTRGLMHTRPGDRLPEGYYKRLVNGEIRNGYPETRRGIRKVTWMNSEGSAIGQEWTGVKWWQPVRAGDENQPASEVAAVIDGDFYRLCPGNAPDLYKQTLTAYSQECDLIPGFDVMLILRGLQQSPVIYDPYNQLELGGGIMDLPTPTPGSGRVTLPNCTHGCYSNDRFWLVYNGDQVVASDSLEFWYNTTNVFRVESGAGSKIVRMVPYGGNAIAVFKTDGVYRIVNTDGDLSNLYVEKVYAAEGCIAKKSVQRLASMFLYMSPTGIEAIQVNGNELISQQQGSFSASISPYFRGLSWPGAGNSAAVACDNYYLWAIPSRIAYKTSGTGNPWGPDEPVVDWDNGNTYSQTWITGLT